MVLSQDIDTLVENGNTRCQKDRFTAINFGIRMWQAQRNGGEWKSFSTSVQRIYIILIVPLA